MEESDKYAAPARELEIVRQARVIEVDGRRMEREFDDQGVQVYFTSEDGDMGDGAVAVRLAQGRAKILCGKLVEHVPFRTGTELDRLKVTEQHLFVRDPASRFAAHSAAEGWARGAGYAVGFMQDNAPRALDHCDGALPKWRNLDADDRRLLAGVLTELENGDVLATVFAR